MDVGYLEIYGKEVAVTHGLSECFSSAKVIGTYSGLHRKPEAKYRFQFAGCPDSLAKEIMLVLGTKCTVCCGKSTPILSPTL